MQSLSFAKTDLASATTALAHTGDNTGTIFGIIIAAVALALIILIIALIVMKRRKG